MKTAAITMSCFLLCGASVEIEGNEGETGSEQAPKQFSLVIRNREIIGDDTVRVVQGEFVELVFASDETVSLHLHGYDIEFEVSPRDQTRISFQAHATGRFPLTSHGFGEGSGHGHRALLYLEVHPD